MWTALNSWIAGVIAQARDEEGQALVEYGLILALIAAVVIIALTALGTDIGNLFNTIAGKI